MSSRASDSVALSDTDIAEIMLAARQVSQRASSDSHELSAVLADPHQALIQAGAPVSGWDTATISIFNTAVVRSAPTDSQLDVRLRDSGPDSWSCWACYYGLKTVMYAAVAAAGIVIAGTGWGLVAAVCVRAVATAIGWTVAAVGGLASGLGLLGVDSAISKLAQMACDAIPNTCSAPEPYTGMWSKDARIRAWGTSAAPSLAGFRSQLLGFHRDNHDGRLWWGAYSPAQQRWSDDHRIDGVNMLGAPSAIALADTLVVLYREANKSAMSACTTSDLQTWSPGIATPIPMGSTDAAALPFADPNTSRAGMLVVAPDAGHTLRAVGVSADNRDVFFTAEIPDANSTQRPALEWFAGQIYCLYSRAEDETLAMTVSSDGAHWSVPTPLGGFSMLGGPAITAQASANLYCVFTGGDQTLRYRSAVAPAGGQPLVWSPEEVIGHHTSSVGPAVETQGNTLVAVHKGPSDNTRVYCTTAAP